MDEFTFKLQNVVKSQADMLSDFEGPLDLILHLLSKNKMAISDLKISELLSQYLEYMQQMQKLDLDMASEFTVMASHLVYLKSKMLLTVGQNQEDEDMALLLRALEERKCREEYDKIQLAVTFLEPLSHIGRSIYAKPAETLVRDPIYKRTHAPEELQHAMSELFARQVRRAPPKQVAFHGIVGSEPFPVQHSQTLLLERLEDAGRITLSAFFDEGLSRSEMVATFLAILELCKEARVRVHMMENGDLEIHLRDGTEETDTVSNLSIDREEEKIGQ